MVAEKNLTFCMGLYDAVLTSVQMNFSGASGFPLMQCDYSVCVTAKSQFFHDTSLHVHEKMF